MGSTWDKSNLVATGFNVFFTGVYRTGKAVEAYKGEKQDLLVANLPSVFFKSALKKALSGRRDIPGRLYNLAALVGMAISNIMAGHSKEAIANLEKIQENSAKLAGLIRRYK